MIKVFIKSNNVCEYMTLWVKYVDGRYVSASGGSWTPNQVIIL